MKILQKLSFLLFLPFLLAGFVSASRSTDSLNIITQVQVTCKQEDATITRTYIQPHKIEGILNFLRLLKCKGKADSDPQQLTGNSFQIILYDASGKRSIYRLRANRFFSKNSSPWVMVSPEQASGLYPLLLSMPSDKKTQSK